MTELRIRDIDKLKPTDCEGFVTATFDEQDEVEQCILNMYQKALRFSERANAGAANQQIILLREKHFHFLNRGLNNLSDAYEALDASRPWLLYWILHSLNLLECDIEKEEKRKISQFLCNCQDDENGGFGGGPGQYSHLAATYAALNALSCLKSRDAFKLVNKNTLLKFLQNMKMVDGSFRMHVGGEVDVRAAYCALVAAKLTNIYSDELFEGTAEWIKKCQTYEGGFGASPGMEAHGGYTFCAVAALCLLNRESLIDHDSLRKWLIFRQLPLEGGFQGRTNKLVDGCYSFWQGACFKLLKKEEYETEDNSFDFNPGGLQEYILICCQHPHGGLIDKPGKQRDFYHTCYSLSGLSASQYKDLNAEDKANPKNVLLLKNEVENLLRPIQPAFNLTHDSLFMAINFFYGGTCNEESEPEEPIKEVTETETLD